MCVPNLLAGSFVVADGTWWENDPPIDGYGDAQHCTNPVADDFSKSNHYDCGQKECSYSAYVRDHYEKCEVTNVCWQ